MKIPNKIKIGGHIFKVKIFSGKFSDDKAGRVEGQKNMIYLNADYVQSKQESVLLHEVIHELDWLNGLGLNEKQIDSLTEGLYQVLKDNKLIK